MNKLSSSRPAAIRIQTQHIVFISIGVLALIAWAYFLMVRIQSTTQPMSHQWTHSSDEVDDFSNDVAPTQMIDITRALVNPAGALPAASDARSVTVIIVSHQEELLQPTVKQLLSAVSHELIAEVLIIDDFSQQPLTFDGLPKDARIHIRRAPERLGLIKSRILGVDMAQGKFIVFIDAHCKVSDDWLRPIVRLLEANPNRLVNMEVGLLNGETWKQERPGAIGAKASFNWKLDHFWEPEEIQFEYTDPAADPDESPITMGMFATTKRWWHTIGGVDSELSMLGGENIEISLRTWLCGGDIRVARGSRIDHLFRPAFPYTVDGKQYRRNLVRIVEAWFDSDAKHNFYRASGFLPGSVDFGSVREQRQLQKKLRCRPFSWYMNRFRKRAPVDRAP